VRPETLLRLYPRAWRERYGEELLAMIGPGALSPQQVLDLVSGAIDAWLSGEVRRATTPASVTRTGGGLMNVKALVACDRKRARYTTRDGLIGAGVMVGANVILVIVGIAAKRGGWLATGEALVNLSFSVALMLSMPFWLTKGQPWKAQGVLIGVTLMLLTAAAYFAGR
jgi:hypothetical protein